MSTETALSRHTQSVKTATNWPNAPTHSKQRAWRHAWVAATLGAALVKVRSMVSSVSQLETIVRKYLPTRRVAHSRAG